MDDQRFVEAVNFIADQMRSTAGYHARTEIEHILAPLRANPKRLEPFGFKVYSQADEDGILQEIFGRLGIEKGSFCEIGLEDGLESNSLFLIHKGWCGSWIEGNKAQEKPILDKFSSLVDVRRLAVEIDYVTPDNIEELVGETLARIGLAKDELDFFSLDIDGNDFYVWQALACAPKVVCIEYNAKFPPPLSKKPVPNPYHVWKGGDYAGSSLVALHELACEKGYTLVGTNITGANAFFVRNDLVGDRFDPDATPANLYHPPRYWLYFHHFRKEIGHPADFGPYTDLVQPPDATA